MANPVMVSSMVKRIAPFLNGMGLYSISIDTQGIALANVLAAHQQGVMIFDGSIWRNG